MIVNVKLMNTRDTILMDSNLVKLIINMKRADHEDINVIKINWQATGIFLFCHGFLVVYSKQIFNHAITYIRKLVQSSYFALN